MKVNDMLTRLHILAILAVLMFFAGGCAQTLTNDKVRQDDAAADQDRAVAAAEQVAAVADNNRSAASPEQGVVANVQAADSQPSIEVTYKLDPRLTSGMYMGERWVSPPTYDTVQTGDTFVMEAAATVRDPDGREIIAKPEWIVNDPEMVSISPSHGTEVTITVMAAGESSLEITSQGVSKTLFIKATIPQENAIRVAITQ